jgi:exopolysaccharide biosynthesis polyprenyl glycosylphosphotransferase
MLEPLDKGGYEDSFTEEHVTRPRPKRVDPPAAHRHRAQILPSRGRPVEVAFTLVLAPLAGAGLVAFLTQDSGTPYEGAVLAFLAFASAAFATRTEIPASGVIPIVNTLFSLLGPIVALGALILLDRLTGLPGLEAGGWLLVLGATAVLTALPQLALSSPRRHAPIRLAVLGSARSAGALARELELAGVSHYEVAGRIAPEDEDSPGGEEVPRLGNLGALGTLVAEHEIDLLIMTGDLPRLAVFEEIARSCLGLPVRLWELSGFYESVFGHVPVAEINASWFQYIMHPRYRVDPPAGQRALDLLVAVVAGLVFLPLLAIFVVLIKLDGGPVLFKQIRIGERGQPFTVYKLRTMRVGTAKEAQWASSDDPRVTAVGRFLRKAHLDEFPQIINVFRGEMSIVGPRPEQPEFVELLEHTIPFYQRRHLVKPGISGWAQVRCGYAGSDVGSAWKLCHDLYYLKHRSIGFYMVILAETVRTLFADRQYAVEPTSVSFIIGSDRMMVDSAPVPAAR